MPRIAGVTKSGMAVGAVMKHAGASVPVGFMACDGSSASTSTYPALFQVIGYTYGGSGGSFNLPDFRGRLPMGDGVGTGLTARSVGQTPGAETHTLGSANLPTHTHGVGTLVNAADAAHTHDPGSMATSTESSHTHSISHAHASGEFAGSVGGSDGSHNHTTGSYNVGAGAGGTVFSVAGSGFTVPVTSSGHGHGYSLSINSATKTSAAGSSHNHTVQGTSAAGSSHTHALSGSTSDGSFANSSVNHVSPALVVKFVIAYV